MAYIYVFINKVNNKAYVGQTTQSIRARYRCHISDAKNDKGYLIHRAIRKYGIENFDFIYEKCDKSNLDQVEIAYIKKLNSSFPTGYNIEPGGCKNKTLSEWSRKKISQNHADVSGKNNPFYGKTHSKLSRQLISKQNKGKLAGENNPFYGKRHTEETRRFLSELSSGKTPSIKTREKISASTTGNKNHFYGRSHSEETKAKISFANMGKNNGKARSVYLINTDGSKERFGSIADAAKKYNLDISCLVKVAKGKRKHHKGFKIKYL